jgi:hypothetical protein
VVADQLECDLSPLARQLLTAMTVVLDQALGREADYHLAHRRRRDAQALSQISGWYRSLIAMQQVESFEVVLLRAGEGVTVLDLDHLN